jgi:hypothetical protein
MTRKQQDSQDPMGDELIRRYRLDNNKCLGCGDELEPRRSFLCHACEMADRARFADER